MTQRRQILLFFGAVLCMSAAFQMHEVFFNNFLDARFEITERGRGLLELPRELPGFLLVVMTGLLAMMPVTRMAVIGLVVFSGGVFAITAWGDEFSRMVVFMMVASAGLHLLQPIGSSIALALSEPKERGRRLGQMGLVGTLGGIGGSALVWLIFHLWKGGYGVAFVSAGVVALGAALFFVVLRVPSLHQPRARLVFKAKYKLYYLMELIFGARKQIFITFGPWVLIRIYGEDPTLLARLFIAASIIGLLFKPWIGAMIDRHGERVVLIAEGFTLAVVCMGYGYAAWVAGLFTDDADTARRTASWIARCCFVADNLLFAVGTARSVYVSRLSESHGETTSTLAMGISMNHVISMSIPFFAGGVWMAFGYDRVFLLATGLALVSAAVSFLVPRKRHWDAKDAAA